MIERTTVLSPGPDRNLALELVRATEAAAIAAGRHLGRGDKNTVDQAAVDAMRPVLSSISMRGTVVIGEGEKDQAPMLYNGERVGNGDDPEVDIAVDPVDGTALTAKSLPNAVAVVALAERGTIPPALPARRGRARHGRGCGIRPVHGAHHHRPGPRREVFIAATGVTDGELLRGVRYTHDEVRTQSLSMRSRSGAVRVIDSRHQLTKSNLVLPKPR